MGTRRTDIIERIVSYESIIHDDYSKQFKQDTREWLIETMTTPQLRHYMDRLEMRHGDRLGIEWSADSAREAGDIGLTGHLSFDPDAEHDLTYKYDGDELA